MARQSSSREIETGNRVLRTALYPLAFVILTLFPSLQTFKTLITKREWNYTPLVYQIAKDGVKKRNELTQRRLLAPYQPPLQFAETPTEEGETTPKVFMYNLGRLWDVAIPKPIIVNIENPTIWQYYYVELWAALISLGVKDDLEAPATASRIKDMLQDTISMQKVEEIRLPSGEEKLKRDIRDKMNEILGGEKIHAVYFRTFFFQ